MLLVTLYVPVTKLDLNNVAKSQIFCLHLERDAAKFYVKFNDRKKSAKHHVTSVEI